MPKILVLEIAVPDTDESWTVSVSMAKMDTGSGIERQIITKRTSREKVICVPEPGKDNFVLSVMEETHESYMG